ncbi:carboxypeptidase regulatory-like domain-containing protein [Mucilaginibacter litoreus]|uniref:Carboxypeptidase regulatory-like domain-containing protein n=1 Tax=Mucilaginibacter litoreus TaxID=1048221 RepID=A0ABW3AMX2_9SPHI
MSSKKLLLLLLLFISSTYSVFAQRDTIGLKTIVTKAAQYINAYPIEKVYLHLDKPYYTAGDTIWFKAYVTIDKHQPTVLSNIVYVDIANNQDSIVNLLKLPVINGVANGSIILQPNQYKQGNYHLRAYTKWMQNFDADYFYNKNIAIGNAIQDGVNASISFNPASAGKSNAVITYKQTGGAAVANKKISWTIYNPNGDEIAKGKSNTDANGMVNISLADATSSQLQKGMLTTILDLGERKQKLDRFPLKAAAEQRDVQFFPEGGELTLGIRSRVAFKAIGADGMGIDIKGTVVDNTGAVVADLKSQHLGMGVFAIQPEDGKTYKANITFANGTSGTYDLPRIRPAGIALGVYNNDPDNLNIKLSANESYFKVNQGKSYYIIAQNGGAVYFAAQTTLDNLTYSAGIPKSKFPTGILQLTLLSERGVPLAERIVFIQHNDMLNIALTPDKKVYTTRQKVKLSVSAKNKTLPVAGNFSVAVIDETKVPSDENDETTILSHLLLTSDIKGYIEKPNYYFLSKNTTAVDDLDILMLTQGYRRISYRNIILDRLPQTPLMPEQEGLQITGMLRNNTGMPISKGNLRLQIPSKNFYAETVTDMVGNFKFSKLSFPDSAEIVLNARGNVNSKNLVVSVNGEPYQPATPNINALDKVSNIDSAFKDLLANSKRQYDNTHTLKEVVIKSTSLAKKPSHSDYSALTGLPMMADQQIKGEIFKDCPNLYTCIIGTLLGVTSEDNNLYFSKNISNPNRLPIQIFLNGKPIDYSFLNSIAGRDVETIEVFKTDGLSSINKNYQSDGIISIITKKVEGQKITLAQLQDMLPKGNILNFNAIGYAKTREFYSPKYDALKQGGSFGGDLRSTIYWNPKVKTDKTGLTSVEFFNADGRGTYRATIEGFDTEGNLGRYVVRYTVK